MDKKVYIKNKKARFDYELSDFHTAGIVLTGTEIKSIRMSKASLSEAYCYFANGELWIKNMNISAYADGSYNNHLPLRDRKLLLTKRELRKLEEDSRLPGFSVIPTALFINDRGLAKVEIALARGKKLYDKRQSIRENEDKRKMAQARKLSY
ncbi:MAG: SsrA-binding protein SmpB [Bacteroidetes bacterium]|uniref:SsrA-binding protein n=1 Tax=Candidatus Enterocola intestinipullorum TaxID=2840783 RepID=A0A9D9EHR0_9BACT|nr:SsrA-binding protein SmpB [Candidatus Enterocola intestinipullorum]